MADWQQDEITPAQLSYFETLKARVIKNGGTYDKEPKNKGEAAAMIEELKELAYSSATKPGRNMSSSKKNPDPSIEPLLDRLRKLWPKANGNERQFLEGIAKNVKIRSSKHGKTGDDLLTTKETAFVVKVEASQVPKPEVLSVWSEIEGGHVTESSEYESAKRNSPESAHLPGLNHLFPSLQGGQVVVEREMVDGPVTAWHWTKPNTEVKYTILND